MVPGLRLTGSCCEADSLRCLLGGGTSCASTLALLADFSTTALQISYDLWRLTDPVAVLVLLMLTGQGLA